MTDRRIRKTENSLQTAFCELIKEKEIQQITVKELCERADINKSTFYLHYHDIYDLASSMKRQLLNDCYNIISEYDILQFASNSLIIWERILDLHQKNNYIFASFSHSSSIYDLSPSLDECIILPIMEKAQKDHPELADDALNTLRSCITFLTSGFIGLIISLKPDELPEAAKFISERLKLGF